MIGEYEPSTVLLLIKHKYKNINHWKSKKNQIMKNKLGKNMLL